ncbi:MAG: hypothetical protein OEY56_12430 [Cyclobacteriaceae bacterium]|nr:hypothetical protein [Cyclobacteriaceae bacterium]
MSLIWYNPDLDVYQKGSMREYDRLLLTSHNKDRFDIVHEFVSTSDHLIDKILNSLNLVHLDFQAA